MRVEWSDLALDDLDEVQQTREIIVQGYRVMYAIEDDRVLILAVMHGSRDLGNPNNQPWAEH